MSHLPRARIRDLERGFLSMYRTKPLYTELWMKQPDGTERRVLSIGGMWSSLELTYHPVLSSEDCPNERVYIHPKQWELIRHVIDGMNNRNREQPVMDIVLHGARRSGKSVVLAVAVLVYMIAMPGSKVLIMGKLIKHGEYIVGWIKRWLDPSLWEWDERDSRLTLCNTSFVRSKSAAHYDSQRGESYHLVVYDEAAFLQKELYEAISPSTTDHFGLNVLSSSPNGHNWLYKIFKKSQSGIPEQQEQVRAVGLSISENTFFTERQVKMHMQKALTFDKDKFKQEILGEWIADTGQAFPDFSERNQKHYPIQGRVDVTKRLFKNIYGHSTEYEWGVSMDFNLDPMVGVIFKVYDDGSVHIVREVVDNKRTEKWGHLLKDTLQKLGCANPLRSAIIIADSSGMRQGVGPKAWLDTPTWDILEQQGWTLDSPTGTKINPKRLRRLQLVRSMLLNMREEIRFYVDPRCEGVIQMFEELDIKHGKPNKQNKWIDYYDGTTYGAYRIWGTHEGEDFFGFPLTESLSEEDETES